MNLKRGRLENLLKQLEVDGAVRYLARQGWERTLQPWSYPTARVEQVTDARRTEQAQMHAYALGDVCRMAFLTGLLDDPATGRCGVCDICAGSRFDAPLDPADVEGAAHFLRGRPLEIEPRRLWPVGVEAVRGAIKPAERLEDGRALCRWGDGGWARDVRHGKQVAGRFDDDLVASLATMVRTWQPQPAPTWVTCVPSQRNEHLVPDLARRVAAELGLPFLEVLTPIGSPAPQNAMQNSAQQVSNIVAAFHVGHEVPSGPVLLVDDIVESRWTLTVVGRLLRLAGSGAVFPVALASATG